MGCSKELDHCRLIGHGDILWLFDREKPLNNGKFLLNNFAVLISGKYV